MVSVGRLGRHGGWGGSSSRRSELRRLAARQPRRRTWSWMRRMVNQCLRQQWWQRKRRFLSCPHPSALRVLGVKQVEPAASPNHTPSLLGCPPLPLSSSSGSQPPPAGPITASLLQVADEGLAGGGVLARRRRRGVGAGKGHRPQPKDLQRLAEHLRRVRGRAQGGHGAGGRRLTHACGWRHVAAAADAEASTRRGALPPASSSTAAAPHLDGEHPVVGGVAAALGQVPAGAVTTSSRTMPVGYRQGRAEQLARMPRAGAPRAGAHCRYSALSTPPEAISARSAASSSAAMVAISTSLQEGEHEVRQQGRAALGGAAVSAAG